MLEKLARMALDVQEAARAEAFTGVDVPQADELRRQLEALGYVDRSPAN